MTEEKFWISKCLIPTRSQIPPHSAVIQVLLKTSFSSTETMLSSMPLHFFVLIYSHAYRINAASLFIKSEHHLCQKPELLYKFNSNCKWYCWVFGSMLASWRAATFILNEFPIKPLSADISDLTPDKDFYWQQKMTKKVPKRHNKPSVTVRCFRQLVIM